ncbi:Uncharacterised protein [Mycobacteroides abscessus subsp. abscessus]|nr:Uncharacterised protein [Mycobacteroides abscessus subsp. abscessus]
MATGAGALGACSVSAGRSTQYARTRTAIVATASAMSTGRRTRRGSTGSSSPAVSLVTTSPGTQPPRSALDVRRPANRSSGDTAMRARYDSNQPGDQEVDNACGRRLSVHRP